MGRNARFAKLVEVGRGRGKMGRSWVDSPGALPRTPGYLGTDDMVELVPKCEDCAALCCVLLPFDAGDAFGFDKAALVPCSHLAGHRCRVHDRLAEAGFPGCVRFDCFGAGQRVVQGVFGGRSWRDDPGLMAPMAAAFRAMRALHEAQAMLMAAQDLHLSAGDEAERLRLVAALDAGRQWTEASLAAFEAGSLGLEVRRYLAGLRGRVRRRR